MTNKKSLKINTVLNIIKTCSAILFPLITFPYISRVLLPENVGKVNFAQSYVKVAYKCFYLSLVIEIRKIVFCLLYFLIKYAFIEIQQGYLESCRF